MRFGLPYKAFGYSFNAIWGNFAEVASSYLHTLLFA
jgi:hypothetical protein